MFSICPNSGADMWLGCAHPDRSMKICTWGFSSMLISKIAGTNLYLEWFPPKIQDGRPKFQIIGNIPRTIDICILARESIFFNSGFYICVQIFIIISQNLIELRPFQICQNLAFLQKLANKWITIRNFSVIKANFIILQE